MRLFLFFVLLAFFTLPAAGQKYREVDLRVEAIGSGTPYMTVLKRLGEPLRRKTEKHKAGESCSDSAETHLTLFYSGLEITLLGDGSGRGLKVYAIEVTSSRWLASGISVGADGRKVITRFGKPISKETMFGETIFHYVTKGNLGGVSFHFRNNKLIKIIMTETLC